METRCAGPRSQPSHYRAVSPALSAHSTHGNHVLHIQHPPGLLGAWTGTHIHTHAYTCVHTCSHRQSWLCIFPLAYLVEWPWKTKQVLSTFDFSAFKLILSAQLLKQLSSPAVSNFRLGTFTGCQVLSLHCESLSFSQSAIVTICIFFKGDLLYTVFISDPVYYISK